MPCSTLSLSWDQIKMTTQQSSRLHYYHYFTLGLPKCAKNKSPHIFILVPQAWTVHTMQVGSMDSCWWCQMLNPPSACLGRRFISPFLASQPTAASHFSYWLKEWNPKRSSAVVAHLDLRLDMLCILRCFSAHHYYKEYLSELLLPFRLPNSLAILLDYLS